jgi:hypothetical protein
LANGAPRFQQGRLEGLTDEPRPGAPRTITDGQVEAVITKAAVVLCVHEQSQIQALDRLALAAQFIQIRKNVEL